MGKRLEFPGDHGSLFCVAELCVNLCTRAGDWKLRSARAAHLNAPNQSRLGAGKARLVTSRALYYFISIHPFLVRNFPRRVTPLGSEE